MSVALCEPLFLKLYCVVHAVRDRHPFPSHAEDAQPPRQAPRRGRHQRLRRGPATHRKRAPGQVPQGSSNSRIGPKRPAARCRNRNSPFPVTEAHALPPVAAVTVEAAGRGRPVTSGPKARTIASRRQPADPAAGRDLVPARRGPRRRGRDARPRHRVPAQRNRRALTAPLRPERAPDAMRTASAGR